MADQQSPELKPIIIQIVGKTDAAGRYTVEVFDKDSGRKISNICAIEIPEITGHNCHHPPKVRLTVCLENYLVEGKYFPGQISAMPLVSHTFRGRLRRARFYCQELASRLPRVWCRSTPDKR